MEPRSLYELFQQATSAHPDGIAFRHKKGGQWVDVTWAEQRATVTRIAKSLHALGVRKGDRVALLSQSRLEWVQVDSAVVTSGAVTVGIYHSNLAPDAAYVLEHSESRIVFVEDAAQRDKLLSARGQLGALERIVIFDGPADPAAGVLSWAGFLDLGRDVADETLERIGAGIEPRDVATLVYTSGTTGVPKGAMITHANLLFTSWAAGHVLVVEPHYHTLLFLPLAHVFARMIVYLCQRCGATVVFCSDVRNVAGELREARPHFLCSVPRVYEKVHERILIAAAQSGRLKRRLFDWALGVGREASERRRGGRPVPPGLALRHALADRLVLRRIRAAFGGRLVWAASGAAPLNPEINAFLHACGVNLIQGLGMTENTSLSNANRLDRNKLDTVGPVVPGVAMKLAEDGEVLFRGDNVMAGYYKDAAATAAAIDEEGWLRSGDIGEIDEDGFLKITDRKKDLIITAGGKNVAPQRIEKILSTSRFISYVIACGDRRKYIAALITLDEGNIRAWARENGLGNASLEALAADERVQRLIESEIAERNAQLASFESVKRFRILPRDLSIETGELTPTLKIKRKAVQAQYADLIEEMYPEAPAHAESSGSRA
jgi:long-chain acyl-CoA synthetase